MTDCRSSFEPSRSGYSFEVRPHAYDAAANPELFEGVLVRRVVAFVIDAVVIAIPVLMAAIFIFVFGLITFGLGWLLFWILSPAAIVWALVYCGLTLGGPSSATIGMRAMELQMRTWYGEPGYFVLGAVRAIVFWVSVTVLTLLTLVVGLLNGRRQLLHDILLGTVVINNPERAASLRGRRGLTDRPFGL